MAPVIYARILTVASDPPLRSTTVHVLKYNRDKERYIILLQPELGDTATKSLCWPTSLVLAVGTSVIASGRTGVGEGFDDEKGTYAVRLDGRKKSVALCPQDCLAAVPGSAAA